jgi:hypothetical protein
MRSHLSSLLGSLGLGKMMQIATRFTMHSASMQAKLGSFILAIKEGVWELLWIYFPSMHI